MKEELFTEFESEVLELTGDEILLLESCLRAYLEQEYRAILEDSSDAIDIVSSVVNQIGIPCHYWWYLLNYTEDIERSRMGEPDPHTGEVGVIGGYAIEAEYNDLELLGKVVAMFDKEEKAKNILAKSDKLTYFFQNFKAAQGQ